MKKVLVVAPHPDDEIIGVGGTILKEISSGNEVYVCIFTKGVSPMFEESLVEKTREEARTCHREIGVKETIFLDFPAVMLEKENRYELNGALLETVKRINPDEVYIPHIGDMQKDHQIVAEACMVALRPKYDFAPSAIYAYETLSETGWNIPNVANEFIPNRFVDISDHLQGKADAMKYYGSQLSPFPNARSIEAIEALAKHRGSLMNVMAAEAFMVVREIC